MERTVKFFSPLVIALALVMMIQLPVFAATTFVDSFENSTAGLPLDISYNGSGYSGAGVEFSVDDSSVTYPATLLNPSQGAFDFSWRPPQDVYAKYSVRHPAWTNYYSYNPPPNAFLLDNVGWNGAPPGSFGVAVMAAYYLDPTYAYGSATWNMWSGSTWYGAGKTIQTRPTISVAPTGTGASVSYSSEYPMWVWDPNVFYRFTATYGPAGNRLYVNGNLWASAGYTGPIVQYGTWALGQNPGYWPYGPHSMFGTYDSLTLDNTQITPTPVNPNVSVPTSYIVYWGTQSGNLTNSVEVNSAAIPNTYNLSLPSGTYYVAMAAKTSTGFVGPKTAEKSVTVVASQPAPVITWVTSPIPTSGLPVEIRGSNFGASPVVRFRGNVVPIISNSDTTIVAALPPGAGTNLTLTVTNGTQSASTSVSYVPPSVFAFAPQSGPQSGGNVMTIDGSNFALGLEYGETVTFGGNAAQITNTNPMQITVIVPPGSGTVPVVVTVGGQSAAAGSYTYKAPLSIVNVMPNPMPTSGGPVTITGTGFAPGAAVLFRSNLLIAQYQNDTLITVFFPPGTGANYPLSVTVAGEMSNTVPISYAPPVLLAMDPAQGSQSGGYQVMLYGNNFAPNYAENVVTFGGATAQVTSGTTSSLAVTVPPGSGLVPVVVTTGGQSSAEMLFRYLVPAPIISANPPDWTNSPAIVTVAPVGAIQKLQYSIGDANWQDYAGPVTIDVPGITRVLGRQVDRVGAIGPAVSVSAKIDRMPPVSQATATGLQTNGWYNNSVQVTITATDAESGVKEVHYKVNAGPDQIVAGAAATFNVSAEGVTDISYLAKDNAGNAEAAKSLTLKLDKSAPAINIAAPLATTYASSDSIVVSFTATDNLSGVATTTAMLNGNTAVTNGQTLSLAARAGDNTLVVTSTDVAGNTSSKSVTFHVRVAAAIDVDPDTLNLKSKSDKNAVTVYVEFPAGYDVATLDLSSVKLQVLGTAIPTTTTNVTAGDYDGDGKKDVTFKFDRQAVIAAMGTTVGDVKLTLTGKLSGGNDFLGTDTIKVINPGK